MTKRNTGSILLMAVLAVTWLQGCAPAVVGGAATGAYVVHDRRSAGTVLDDQIIELKAHERIRAQPDLAEQAHINVTSYNYVLLVTGEVPTEALLAQAHTALQSIPKVRKIHNELVIAAPSALMSRSSDAWITAKVKTKLFGIEGLKDFDPTRVNVTTERGTVYLMGRVTRAEADAVTEVARRVKGVQRVVKVFEYSD